MKTAIKNNKGFTLIELIVVTLILGVLAAVAVPRYMGSVSNAEAAAEAGTVAAMRTAVENYAMQLTLNDLYEEIIMFLRIIKLNCLY